MKCTLWTKKWSLFLEVMSFKLLVIASVILWLKGERRILKLDSLFPLGNPRLVWLFDRLEFQQSSAGGTLRIPPEPQRYQKIFQAPKLAGHNLKWLEREERISKNIQQTKWNFHWLQNKPEEHFASSSFAVDLNFASLMRRRPWVWSLSYPVNDYHTLLYEFILFDCLNNVIFHYHQSFQWQWNGWGYVGHVCLVNYWVNHSYFLASFTIQLFIISGSTFNTLIMSTLLNLKAGHVVLEHKVS